MDEQQAIAAFAALAQETRLRILRLLIVAGQDGIAAGEIGAKAGVSASNVSFHLKELEQAGLLRARREARSIIYSVQYEALAALIRFLMEDCCGGRPEVCAPIASLACCVPNAGCRP